MVCPICITTAIVANAPIISASMVGGVVVSQKIKNKFNRVQIKNENIMIKDSVKTKVKEPCKPQDDFLGE